MSEDITKRATELAEAINLFLLEMCKTEDYSAQELYGAITLLKERMRHIIVETNGAEALVSYDDCKEC